MVRALNLLLTGCLLQGALCRDFKVFMPETVKVLSGSCVIIPCSFDIKDEYDKNLDHTCKAIWYKNKEIIFDSSTPQQDTIKGKLTGNLLKKDCSTMLNIMHPDYKDNYEFRLECNNGLRFTFPKQLKIHVTADPPTLTLTPSRLEGKEGTSVNLTCSAPAPCLSHPPALTWTPSLGHSQETLQENENKTKIMTSVLTFTASHLHHGKEISCTAAYNKQDGSTGPSVSRNVTADISYLPQNITVSVSPSRSVPEDSNVTLTCSSNANPAVRNYTWYSADGGQEIFMGTGSFLKIKAPKASFFCKAENDLGAGRSNNSQIDIQFAPKILPSSDCAKPTGQINCSCESMGNPSPKLHWYLDGLPVNTSDKFTISINLVNGTALVRSIIIVNKSQKKDLSNLVCRSTNSLGSASQKFCVHSAEHHEGPLMLPVFITTVVALLVIVCALLFVIRAQRIRHKLPNFQCKGDTSTVAVSQLLTSEEGNEVPNTADEDIYANVSVLGQSNTTISETNSTNLPRSEIKNADGDDESSVEKEKEEERSSVIYSSVNWKREKKKGKDSGDMDQPGRSYLEEERCMAGDMCRDFVSNAVEMGNLYDEVVPKIVKKEAECEYAEVKFKDKNAMHK
ncbi:sialic acid-binding Ig-like lectin 5 isoform X1 [Thunnus thynnus]|uniref:sialic acid-binding Ig-like lectin 5 isoform X1 n=1 Tax=Thunnus thynnus TaxID=8237 RepID=UPI00352776AA